MINLKTILKNVQDASKVYWTNDITETTIGYNYLDLQMGLMESIENDILLDEYVINDWCKKGALSQQAQNELYRFAGVQWADMTTYVVISQALDFLTEFKEYKNQLEGIKRDQTIHITQDQILDYNLNLSCSSCGSDWTGSNSTKIKRVVKSITKNEYGDLVGEIKVSGQMLQVEQATDNTWNIA